MNRHTLPGPRRLLASLTCVVIVSLGVVIPLLDGTGTSLGATLEAAHHGSACVVHDHTLCTQFGAQQGLLPDAPLVRPPVLLLHISELTLAETWASAHLAGIALPRAPPFHRA